MFRVLKSSSARQTSEPTAFRFTDLDDAAARELEAARLQADEILAAARLEAAALQEEALERGRAQARAEFDAAVAAEVEKRMQVLTPTVRQIAHSLDTARAECLTRWENAGLDVALAIAQRIIRREVQQTPQIGLALVRESLELAAGSTEIKLLMHPADVTDLSSALETLLAELGVLGRCEIVSLDSIERGGCRVETRCGSIDQQFETQLARIAEELR
jgi:flagellar assembly protein FliH